MTRGLKMLSTETIAAHVDEDGQGRPVVLFTGQHGERGVRRCCRVIDGGRDRSIPHFVLEISKQRDWRWRAAAALVGAAIGFVPIPLVFETILGMTHVVRHTIWETIIPALILASTAGGALAGFLLSRGRGYWLAGAVPLSALVGFVVRDSVAVPVDVAGRRTGGVSRIVRADFSDGHAPIEVLWTMAPAEDAAELAALLTRTFVPLAGEESETASDAISDSDGAAAAKRGTSESKSAAARDDIPGRL